jgi:hypothetical protein
VLARTGSQAENSTLDASGLAQQLLQSIAG